MRNRIKKGDLVEIVWDDASGMETDELEEYKPSDGLISTTSYGKVKYIGRDAIQIIHEHATNDVAQVTTIPRGWMVKGRVLKYRDK